MYIIYIIYTTSEQWKGISVAQCLTTQGSALFSGPSRNAPITQEPLISWPVISIRLCKLASRHASLLGATPSVLPCWRGEKNNPTWQLHCLFCSPLLGAEWCVTGRHNSGWRSQRGLLCSVGDLISEGKSTVMKWRIMENLAKESFHPDSC